MKFENIIIGGGLSGLVAGITLAKAGKKVAIVAAGQSTLHFASGSFDLLGYTAEGKEVEEPLKAIEALNENHPYKKLGDVAALAEEAAKVLAESGLKVKGDAQKNHYRVTPMGILKPTWLTLEDYITADSAKAFPYKKVVLVNIAGFLDFPVEFIEAGLKKVGVEVEVKIVTTAALQERRMSASEMRSANIAKVLGDEENLQLIADKLNNASADADAILMPAIIGLNGNSAAETLQKMVKKPIAVIATVPPSVPGVRIQNMLKTYFEKLGGTFMLGSSVQSGVIEGGKLVEVTTSTMQDDALKADNFILATGSFQSGGLNSNFVEVFEPLFHLDVDSSELRTEWINQDAFQAQPYMEYGVKTNASLQVMKNGQTIENLYAIGSILSGHNAIKQADGTGVSLLSAIAVAKNILNK